MSVNPFAAAAHNASSLGKIESQLKAISDKINFERMAKVAESRKMKSSLMTSVFSKLCPAISVLWTLLGPALKNELGMVDTNLQSLMNLLKEVKQLQLKTLDAISDVHSLIQDRDADAAQIRLDGLLNDLSKLSHYQYGGPGYTQQQEDILKKIEAHALDDLRAMHCGLVGKKDGTIGQQRIGMLEEYYRRQYRRFEDDPTWSIPQFAKALDTYLLLVSHVQWTYFMIWSATCASEADIEKQAVEGAEFAQNLLEQENRFAELRPLGLDYFIRDSSMFDDDRRFLLRQAENNDKILMDVRIDSKFGPALNIHQFDWQDDCFTDITCLIGNSEMAKMNYWDVGHRWRLEEYQEGNKPVVTSLDDYLGASGTVVKLESPVLYFNSGFLTLNQEDHTWASSRSLPGFGEFVSTSTDRNARAKLQIIPVDERTLNKPGSICIHLRDTQGERRFVQGFKKLLDEEQSKNLVLEDLGSGQQNEERNIFGKLPNDDGGSCVIM